MAAENRDKSTFLCSLMNAVLVYKRESVFRASSAGYMSVMKYP